MSPRGKGGCGLGVRLHAPVRTYIGHHQSPGVNAVHSASECHATFCHPPGSANQILEVALTQTSNMKPQYASRAQGVHHTATFFLVEELHEIRIFCPKKKTSPLSELTDLRRPFACSIGCRVLPLLLARSHGLFSRQKSHAMMLEEAQYLHCAELMVMRMSMSTSSLLFDVQII